ncbi:MAG TPA: Ig-like domain-containing protein [Gemmatimonadaceae bacterium]|nr:Ig-like domain-containing protein [Gemmatimonadaceae bacterium]
MTAPSEANESASRLLTLLRETTAGEYEIRGELGRGGMAAVYLAYDLRLNRKVAIKVMLPELAFHDGMEERFKREARTAAKLDHQHIVVIYSVRDDAELLYFVMKYIEGASLDQLLRGYAPLPIPIVQHLLVQLADALQYAHDEGVVHRDVKPANVLVDRRGNAMVTDFGIARASESPHLTRTGSVIGTPAYMSPEQCLANEQTHASDQYALGVVAYELLAGRPPFTGPMIEIQWAHVKEPPPPLLSFRPECPPVLAAAVMRMLSKAPEQRWPSLHDARASFAAGLVAGDDSPRAQLADLVRFLVPTPTQAFAVTPASPLPRGRSGPREAARVTMDLAPTAVDLEIDATQELVCKLRDSNGATLPGSAVVWASSNPAVASVDVTGIITARSLGSADITATSGAMNATAKVSVVPDKVAELSFEPRSVSLEERGTGRLVVRATNARGKTIGGRPVVLTSSDPKIATVATDGVVTAKSAGRATISAALDGKTATAEVIVRLVDVGGVSIAPSSPTLVAGTSTALTAAARDRKGSPLGDRTIAWQSSDPSIVKVDANGRVTGVSAGSAAITAECSGVVASVRVNVVAPTIAEVKMVAAPTSLRAGRQARIKLEARDTAGTVLEPRSGVTWKSSDPNVATVAPDGTVSALAEGSAVLSAVVNGHEARTTLAVQPPPAPIKIPRAVPIGAGVATLVVAGVLIFMRTRGAEPTSRPPSTLPRPETPAAAPIPAPQPQPPPVSVGTATRPPDVKPPDVPTVTPPAAVTVASLRVTSPSPMSIEVGERRRASLSARMSDGSSSTPPRATWTVADRSIATVTNGGEVSGVRAGSTVATAKVGDAAAQLEIRVNAQTVNRVAIQRRVDSVRVGQTVTLEARVFDGRDNRMDAPVIWRSLNTAIATMTGGTVHGVRVGDVIVSATSGLAADSVHVVVLPNAAVAVVPPVRADSPSRPPVPAPGATTPTTPPASSGYSGPRFDADTASQSLALAVADAIRRGGVGPVSAATKDFSNWVKENKPETTGTAQVRAGSRSESLIEQTILLPVKWTMFAGGRRTGTVELLVTYERTAAGWQRTSVKNVKTPR